MLLINSEMGLRINNDIKKGWMEEVDAHPGFGTMDLELSAVIVVAVVSAVNAAPNRDGKTGLHTFKRYLNLYIIAETPF